MDAVEAKALTQEIKAQTQKHWKMVRSLLIQLEEGGGHQLLGYPTFGLYVKSEFKECDNLKHFNTERASGKVERLLGIPVGTYASWALTPLRQFRGVQECYRGARDRNPQIALTKQCWNLSKEIASRQGREMPNAEDIITAKKQMHLADPEKISKPSFQNGAERWKTKSQELQTELENLKKAHEAQVSRLKTKYVGIKADLDEAIKAKAKAEAQLQVLNETQYLVGGEN